MRNLDLALSSFNEYVNLTQIPGVFDDKTRKFTNTGSSIMSSFGAPRLSTIIDVYLTSLDYFIEIDRPSPIHSTNMTLRRMISNNIIRNINYTDGSVDGIILFQKLLQDLIAQISNVLSVGSNSVGAEATKSLPPSDRIGLLKNTTIGMTEFFENTIGARFINDIYVDNISAARVNTRRHPGLRVYEGTDLSKASVTEVTPFNSITIGTSKAAEAQGVIVNIMPNLELNNLLPNPLQQISAYGGSGGPTSGLPASKFLGKNSPGADKNLNSQTLSAKDLKTDVTPDTDMASLSVFQGFKINKSLRTQGVVSDGISSFTSEELKGEVEVLTSYSVDSETLYKGILVSGKTYMIRNAVFETKKLGDLKSSVSNRYYLCRQRAQGLKEVVDTYFLLNPVSVTFVTTQDIASMTPEPLSLPQSFTTVQDIASTTPEPLIAATPTVTGPNEIMQQIASTTPEPLFSSTPSTPASQIQTPAAMDFTTAMGTIASSQLDTLQKETNLTTAVAAPIKVNTDLAAAVAAPANTNTVAKQFESVAKGMTPQGVPKASSLGIKKGGF